MTASALDLLEQARRGDEAATAQVLEENSGLIWAVVRRYYGKGAEPDDLYQLGCLGFLKAVRGFDAGYGTQFSTYAVPKIAGEIRRYLRDNSIIKVGRTLKEQGVSIYAARERLRTQSTLASPATEEGMVERIALRAAIGKLPERERETILLRFFKGLTQQQCARVLGVSQVQVSRLEKRAIEKLRQELG